jgi:hypothetical protein
MSVTARKNDHRLVTIVRPTPPRWLELALVGALAVFALIPLVGLLRHAATHGLVLSGADSPYPADQFQYEAWIRQFGSGVLAGNTLDTAPSHRVFLHPMFLLSGLAWRAGLSIHVTYLLWMPVALVVFFLGFRAYVARFLTGTWERLAALAVALFFISPVRVGAIVPSSAVLLWGYLPSALAVGLMPLFLLGVEGIARGGADGALARRSRLLLVCACGAAVSWLHPWQGEVLLVTVAGALVLGRERRRQARLVLVPMLALLGPLLYYFVLSRADPAWSYAQHANQSIGHLGEGTIVLALAPIVVPALAGLPSQWDELHERMLVLWLPAVLAVYYVFSPSFPQHAFEGVGLPLAILAIRGLRRVKRRVVWGAALAAVLIVPGSVRALELLRDTVHIQNQPFYLQPGEDQALSYLSKVRESGAVLPTPYLGSLVPARTGRQTWIGHPSWTRDFAARASAADALFDGRLSDKRVRALVKTSSATFILDDCGRHAAALRDLQPIALSIRRFGCATVYRVPTSP